MYIYIFVSACPMPCHVFFWRLSCLVRDRNPLAHFRASSVSRVFKLKRALLDTDPAVCLKANHDFPCCKIWKTVPCANCSTNFLQWFPLYGLQSVLQIVCGVNFEKVDTCAQPKHLSHYTTILCCRLQFDANRERRTNKLKTTLVAQANVIMIMQKYNGDLGEP